MATIHDLARQGDIAGVLRACASGAVDERDEEGRTATYIAANEGHLPLVRALLALGADPNLPEREGDGPLHVATHRGHVEVARALLDGGADPEMRGYFGHTPLRIATRAGHDEIAGLLATRGGGLALDRCASTRTSDPEVLKAILATHLGAEQAEAVLNLLEILPRP
jgi:ankyrin repeat protein